jgi:hypothetical protein
MMPALPLRRQSGSGARAGQDADASHQNCLHENRAYDQLLRRIVDRANVA